METSQPARIISSPRMPDVTGFGFCKKLKQTPAWAEIPFIFLTGSKSVEDKSRGVELGVEEYLTKPIYIKESVTRVQILLHEKEMASLEQKRETKTKVKGQLQPGGPMPSITLKGVSAKGESRVQYAEAVAAAQSDAQSALNQEQVPKAYKNSVRDYFDDLKR